MAKKKADAVPTNPFANYLSRKRFVHVTNAGANEEFTVVETGMEIPGVRGDVQAFAWEIHAVSIGIGQYGSGNVGDGEAFAMFELLSGEKGSGDFVVAGDDGDSIDDDLIADCYVQTDRDTDGSFGMSWPIGLDIQSPIPYFGKKITFASRTSNSAFFNSLKLFVNIWWAPIPIDDDNVFAMLKASGAL